MWRIYTPHFYTQGENHLNSKFRKILASFPALLVLTSVLVTGMNVFAWTDGSETYDYGFTSGSYDAGLVGRLATDFEAYKYVGIDMELAKMLADSLGKELVIKPIDFDSIFQTLNTDGADIGMAGITKNEERAKLVSFSDSYYNAAQKLIVKSNDTKFKDVKSKEDVETVLKSLSKDVKIGVQTGTTAHDALQKMQEEGVDVEILPYEKITQCFDDVSLGRADAVYVDSVVAAYYLADDDSKFQSVWKSDEGEPMGVCIKKGNTDLLEQTENAINTLYYNGKISELAMKHFGTDVTEGVRNVTEEPTVDPSKVKTVKDGVLTIGFEAGYPPLEYTDDSGLVYQGFDVDMAEEIGKLFGLEVEFVNTSFDGVFAGLDKGQYDMIIAGVSITPERQEAYEMTEPYLSNQLVIVTKKDA